MPSSSIGTATFIAMRPQPVVAGQQLIPEAKAGVANVGWWKAGSKGTEYSVETVRDVATFADAVALAAAYRTLQDAGALAITYGGVSLGNVLVLSVEATAEKIVQGHGGIAGTSEAIVRAQWRLVAV